MQGDYNTRHRCAKSRVCIVTGRLSQVMAIYILQMAAGHHLGFTDVKFDVTGGGGD